MVNKEENLGFLTKILQKGPENIVDGESEKC